MRDQGLTCGECLAGVRGRLEPDGRITTTVEFFVRLPGLGAALGDGRGGIRVDATHVEVVDRFRTAS
jgi:hypothetical protein